MADLETAIFGGGCFWCLEAVFSRVHGVKSVESGYAGGQISNPNYQQVCSGNTGHAEVVRVTFDPAAVSYRDLLDVFFAIHDPTTLNRQGNDHGTQYRSVIFYNNAEQQLQAKEAIAELAAGGDWSDPIVTIVEAAGPFYAAEDYHQQYYANNSSQPYCRFVIAPKVQKLEKLFAQKLRA